MPSNVTTPSQWKKSAGAKPVDLELPSGNIARVRQIPMPTLLAEGIFPDSLRGYVQKAIGEEAGKAGLPQDHKGKKGKKESAAGIGEAEMQEMMADPAKLADMFAVFDKVLVLAVIEPKVLPAPENESDRDEELLYADEVDMEDKTFIFQFCVGGSKDLDRFRTESTPIVGGLAAVKELPGTP